MTSRKNVYLQAMGIPSWQQREDWFGVRDAPLARHDDIESSLISVENDAPSVAVPPSRVSVSDGEWGVLARDVRECTACDLHQSRTQTVFGVGDQQAQWLILGEAPGADEDKQGEPFVGRAGQLLNEMLFAIGLKREDVFIANILKCRPPANRNPRPDEAQKCEPFLQRQIQLLQPKIILSIGAVSAQNLLKTEEPVGRLRGRTHYFSDVKIPVIVTYHPAFLLRSPLEKRKAWADLVYAMQVFRGTV